MIRTRRSARCSMIKTTNVVGFNKSDFSFTHARVCVCWTRGREFFNGEILTSLSIATSIICSREYKHQYCTEVEVDCTVQQDTCYEGTHTHTQSSHLSIQYTQKEFSSDSTRSYSISTTHTHGTTFLYTPMFATTPGCYNVHSYDVTTTAKAMSHT